MTITPTIKTAAFLVISLILLVLHGALVAQTPPTNQAPRTGSLKQIIPGHYVYTTNNEGRLFNSGIVATNDGVLVFDALDTDAIARAERQAIRLTEAVQSTPMSSRSPTKTTAPGSSTRCSAGTFRPTCSGSECRTPPIAIA
jgi:hypothetical protein